MMAKVLLSFAEVSKGIGLCMCPAHECTSTPKPQQPHYSPARQTATETSSNALYTVACPSGGLNFLRWSVCGDGSSCQITP